MTPRTYIGADLADDDEGDDALPLFAPRPSTPFDAGMAGSERAASKWSAADRAQLDAAVRGLIARGEPFTADDIWRACPEVPVTKGLASFLRPFANAKQIENSGQTRVARRGNRHDHAQRLTVWNVLRAGAAA